jgi:hypothetical protein
MPENNNIMSVEGQLVGMPLAGPESFSQQQLDYLKRALGVDETVLWTGEASGASATMSLTEAFTNFKRVRFYIDEGNSNIPYQTSECETNGSALYLYPSFTRTNSNSALLNGLWTLQSSNDHKTFTISIAVLRTNGGTQATNSAKFVKIVGIGRKESA